MKTLTEQYRGNVPLGIKYKLVDVTYRHKDDEFAFSSCDNCGHLISNVYTIQSEDGKKYDVGSECVEAILGHSLELIEAKRLMSLKRRFLKKLLTETKSVTLHDCTNGGKSFRFYKLVTDKWNVNAIGYGNYERYKVYIDRLNVPVTDCGDK